MDTPGISFGKRQGEIIDAFQDYYEIKIFLSTDAGGVGVNLQSANILINLDIPWNPAVLEQRIGRIYRLGQKKHVNVFNFIARKSIEHRILYLLDFKKSVFEGVIEEEGQDSVMLEGFLESVKALTEVDLNENDGDETGTWIAQRRNIDNLADENNRKVLEEFSGNYHVNDITIQKSSPSIRNNKVKEKVRMFTRIKTGLKKFLRRFGR